MNMDTHPIQVNMEYQIQIRKDTHTHTLLILKENQHNFIKAPKSVGKLMTNTMKVIWKT